MWSKAFWKATAERAISTAAQAALLVLGAEQVNVITVSWPEIGGFAAGGAALAILKALIVGAKDGNPSAINAEYVPTVPDDTGANL